MLGPQEMPWYGYFMNEKANVEPTAGAGLAVDEGNTIERIRLNALEHFSKHGYMGASVREITHAARVTKPTLYYYFRNKEELYRGLATSCMASLHSSLKGCLDAGSTLKDRFCALISSYHTFCDQDFLAARFIHVISFTPPRDVPDVGIEAYRRGLNDLIQKMVQEATAITEVKPDEASSKQLILEGLFAVAIEKRLNGIPLSLDEVRRCLDCLLSE